MCFARVVVPGPELSAQPSVALPEADVEADVEPAVATAAAAGSRRARRAEFDQLADTMLSELAASQSRVTLPGPIERGLGRIGLTAGEGRSRKGLGIVVVCAALVIVFTVLSTIAGLFL